MLPTAEDAAEASLSDSASPERTVTSVFHEHGRFAFRLLRRLGVPAADADDVFQEVFVVVHKKLPHFTPRGSLRAWLYGICIRRAANYRKRNRARRERTVDRELEGVDATTPLEMLDARDARAVLDAILNSLPDQKREVFILHVIEELPMHEVADALGCPLHTAYSRFYAARRLVTIGIRRTRAQMRLP